MLTCSDIDFGHPGPRGTTKIHAFLFSLWGLGCGFGSVDLSGDPFDAVVVCVDGDAGHCCSVLSDSTCTESGCEPLVRTANRCLRCTTFALQDAGARDFSTPPPNPPDASIEWVEVCGRATYTVRAP
jgi:hypothetical protein